MAKAGKGSVQNGRCKVHQNQVQTTPRLILSLEMGTAIRNLMLRPSRRAHAKAWQAVWREPFTYSKPKAWYGSPEASSGQAVGRVRLRRNLGVQFPGVTRLSASVADDRATIWPTLKQSTFWQPNKLCYKDRKFKLVENLFYIVSYPNYICTAILPQQFN